jgi:hypothetical protein
VANKYPYVASAGPLLKTIGHLRKSFPSEVNAETLRKLGVAPQNESYAINVLRFLGVIDENGKKVDAKAVAFIQHKEELFASEFAKVVKDAYAELFELHGDGSWTLDRSALTQFFRTTDRSSDVVGSRQAGTFAALSALAGHAELPKAKASPSDSPKNGSSRVATRSSQTKKTREVSGSSNKTTPIKTLGSGDSGNVGLTVRIEVNLPANGDQDTYDKIFQSIRKNLIDGK